MYFNMLYIHIFRLCGVEVCCSVLQFVVVFFTVRVFAIFSPPT